MKMNRSCGTAENQGTSWSAWFHRTGLVTENFAEAGPTVALPGHTGLIDCYHIEYQYTT
jgi:hypothetical protein